MDPDVARRAFDRLVLSGMGGLMTSCSAPDRRHPTTYVVLERDRVLPPDAQERLAAKADEVERLPTSHSPMLADPEGLAAVLARVPVLVE